MASSGKCLIAYDQTMKNYLWSCYNAGEGFTSFIDAREKAGHPVTLTRLRNCLPRLERL